MIQIGGVYTALCQKEGILLPKYRDRNGRCIAILFESIGVRGRFDSPDHNHSGNNLTIIFLCICSCYEVQIMSEIIFICCAAPARKNSQGGSGTEPKPGTGTVLSC